MSDGPAVGTLSADGSRQWDGRYWIHVAGAPAAVGTQTRLPPRPLVERFVEPRGVGIPGVVLAIVVGLVLSRVRPTLPPAGSIQDALAQLVWFNLAWLVLTNGTVILILSFGRHGVDVMLVRAMFVAFVFGAALFLLPPLAAYQAGWTGFLVVLVSGLVWAVLVGPIYAVWASVANLVWYRGVRQLSPQILRAG